MNNLLEDIYNAVVTVVETHQKDYIDSLNNDEDTDVRIKPFVNIHRESADMYKLPAYPSLVMGYGAITFGETHTTTHEEWRLPISLYAVTSGAQATKVQRQVEMYAYMLWSMFMDQDYPPGEAYATGMGVSPVFLQGNMMIQVGYLDLELRVLVPRQGS